jgi:hypothetical protein
VDSGRIWSQSTARRAIMGKERTHNPSPAASALLGKRTIRSARRILKRKGRKSYYRGNPAPAIAAVVAEKIGLGRIFKTPSEKRAAAVAGQAVSSAASGNLTAAKMIAERTMLGIQKERAVWRAALKQIPPKILALVKKYDAQIPGVDHSTPESAVADALAREVNGVELEAAAEEVASQSRAAAAANARERAAANRQLVSQGIGAVEQLGIGLGRVALRGSRRRRSRRRRY